MRLSCRLALVLLVGFAGCHSNDDDDVPVVKKVPKGPVATCAELDGSVQSRRAGGSTWEDVAPGAVLKAGDAVRTGPSARLRLTFTSGGAMRLAPGTVVVVAPGDAPEDEPAFALQSGEVSGDADGPARAFSVMNESGEGVEARVTWADGEKVSWALRRARGPLDVSVGRGAAHVRAKTWFVDLAAGEGVPVTGTAPLVEKLLPAPKSLRPDSEARFTLSKTPTVTLEWEPVEGAAGYRVEVARDAAFTKPVRTDDVSADASLAFTPLEAGSHFWRVSTLDGRGRPGEPGEARRFEIVAKAAGPQRELLLKPAAGSVVGEGETLFSWTAAGDKARYRLVISRSEDLTADIVFDQRTTQTSLRVPRLSVGEYRWGVFLDGEPATPLFKRARRLVVGDPSGVRFSAPKAIRPSWGK